MNWKAFFEPTLQKLVLFVILFSLFVPFLYYDNGCINKMCSKGVIPCDTSEGPISIILLLISHFDGNNCVTIYSVEKISTKFAIFGLLVTYLVACGIISVHYSKIKKK